MSIAAIKNEYLRICQAERKLSPHTIRSYAYTLTDFTDFLQICNLVKIEDITKKEIHAYIQNLNSHLKPTSVLQKKAVIHAFFEYAVAEELIEYSPL